MMTAFASFLIVETNRSYSYRIRLNNLASKLLDGAECVKLTRTDKHLVIEAIEPWKAEGERFAANILRRTDGGAYISIGKLVSDDLIRKTMFGKRYKVKRDKAGKVYICLQEEVR